MSSGVILLGKYLMVTIPVELFTVTTIRPKHPSLQPQIVAKNVADEEN